MRYDVRVTDEVYDAMRRQAHFIATEQRAPRNAEKWLESMWDAIDSLEELPLRYPVAEPESAAAGFEIRKQTVGRHLVFYRVNEKQRIVDVLSLRHASQRTG